MEISNMDISEAQIAKLVLGYLRESNCISACKEFVSSSPELRGVYGSTIKKDKFFATRVGGRRLQDFIFEYFKIATLVQARLEASNYYSEYGHTANPTLTEQITYLLDNARDIRMQTPFIPLSRCSTPHHPTQFQNTSPTDSISHELAHNITQFNMPSYSGFEQVRKKNPPQFIQPPNEFAPSEIFNISNEQKEIISQKILSHHELCEKIAENINSSVRPSGESQYVRSPETLPTLNKTLHKELNSKMQTIIQKTEEDPLFEKLLGEIIGCGEANKSSEKENESSSTEQGDMDIGSFLVKQKRNEEDPVLASHNNDAVESLIAVSKNVPTHKPIANMPAISIGQSDISKVLNVCTNSGEVIMYKGSMDNYIKSNTAHSIVNKHGLLMIQPSVPTMSAVNFSKTGSNKLIHIIDSKSVTPAKNKVLTEKDIMGMTTVLVDQDSTINSKRIVRPKPNVVPLKNLESTKTKKGIKCMYPTKPTTELSCQLFPQPPQIIQSSTETLQTVTDIVKTTENIENLSVPNVTPDLKTHGTKKTTPKSASHVRQLNFNSPVKKVLRPIEESPTSSIQKSVSKSLKEPSESKPKLTAANSQLTWDAQLRMLATAGEKPEPNAAPKIKKKSKAKKVAAKITPDSSLNNIQEEAEKIESELQKMMEDEPEKQPKTKAKQTKKSTKSKKAAEAKKEKTVDIKNAADVKKVDPKPEEQKSETMQKIDITTSIGDLRFGLKNVNAKANYKRKCNIDNVSKDTKVIKVKDVKPIEVIMNGSNKIVLSPSKLKASKRFFVTSEVQAVKEVADDINKLITPEVQKVEQTQPVSSKCNLTPMLETPIKVDCLPKTPQTSFFSPINPVDTPFTKVFKEQMCGVDLSNIKTPLFPLTPNIPITPHMAETGYCNRPTDYSTSSSYYQPSDNEQNKSLEKQVIEECKRLEKTSPMVKRNEVLYGKNDENSCKLLIDNKSEISPNEKCENYITNMNRSREEGVIAAKFQPQQQIVEMAISEQIKSMKGNMIGRKNIQLSKPPSILEESSSSASSETDADYSDEETNNTIIESSNKPATRFSMRLRSKVNTSLEEKNSTVQNTKQDENIQKIIQESIKDKTGVKTQIQANVDLINDLEAKRKRVIAKIKDPPPPKETPLKEKPVKDITKKNAANKKKETPKKVSTEVGNQRSVDNSKEQYLFHVSSDDEFENSDIFESYMKSINEERYKTSTPEDRRSAESLVKHLEQRGIHLIHNKTEEAKQSTKNIVKDRNESSQDAIDKINEVHAKALIEVRKIQQLNSQVQELKDKNLTNDKTCKESVAKEQKPISNIHDTEATKKTEVEIEQTKQIENDDKIKEPAKKKQVADVDKKPKKITNKKQPSKTDEEKNKSTKVADKSKHTTKAAMCKNSKTKSLQACINMLIKNEVAEKLEIEQSKDVQEASSENIAKEIINKASTKELKKSCNAQECIAHQSMVNEKLSIQEQKMLDLEDGEILNESDNEEQSEPIKTRIPKIAPNFEERTSQKHRKWDDSNSASSASIKPKLTSENEKSALKPTSNLDMSNKWLQSIQNYEEKEKADKSDHEHKNQSELHNTKKDEMCKKKEKPQKEQFTTNKSPLEDLYGQESSRYNQNQTQRKTNIKTKSEENLHKRRKSTAEDGLHTTANTQPDIYIDKRKLEETQQPEPKTIRLARVSMEEYKARIASAKGKDPLEILKPISATCAQLVDVAKPTQKQAKSNIIAKAFQMTEEENTQPSSSFKEISGNKQLTIKPTTVQKPDLDLMEEALLGQNSKERAKKRKATTNVEGQPPSKKGGLDLLHRVNVENFLKDLHGSAD